MGLIESINQICGEDAIPAEYRITLFGGGCAYVEGVRRIKSFSQTEIVLCFKRCSVKIKGREMRLERFCGGDVAVKGRVDSVERASV
jgi:sporulation protein YqfC